MKRLFLLLALLPLFAGISHAQTFSGSAGSHIYVPSPFKLCFGPASGNTGCLQAYANGAIQVLGGLVDVNGNSIPYASGLAAALPGFCTVPSMFLATDTDALYGCVGGSFVAISGGGSVGPGTTGFIPSFATSTTIGNSHCDDGVTLASTINCSENIRTTGSMNTGVGGTTAGLDGLGGNTSNPSLPSNAAGWLGPSSASFTSYFGQFPSTAPSAHSVVIWPAPSANVAAFSFKVIPDCQDTGGNHLNYTQSSDTFSCGTTGSGGAPQVCWLFQAAGASISSTDFYTSFGDFASAGATNSGSVTQSDMQFAASAAGTIKNLMVRTTNTNGTNALTVAAQACTPSSNACSASDSTVVATIGANAGQGEFSDTTHSLSYAAGDLITFHWHQSSGVATAKLQSICWQQN